MSVCLCVFLSTDTAMHWVDWKSWHSYCSSISAAAAAAAAVWWREIPASHGRVVQTAACCLVCCFSVHYQYQCKLSVV